MVAARSNAPGTGRGDEPAEVAMELLGLKIAERRRAKGLTLVGLAKLSGLSQPFLSQIERGRARPSMESLHRIAIALETTTPALMSNGSTVSRGGSEIVEIDDDDVCLVRADQGALVSHSSGKARSLVAGARSMYPLQFLVEETEFEQFYQHDEPEFVHVVSGHVEIEIEGRGIFQLGSADTLYFEGGVKHRWRLNGVWPAQLIVVQAALSR
jgi:transcriptional regulator with XRE-family HTH domain